MTLDELYMELENANAKDVVRYGVIVFSEDNWDEEYSLESRSYVVSSENRRFKSGAIANSMFGDSLDHSDMGVRLDAYMGDGGWKVEDCYMLD